MINPEFSSSEEENAAWQAPKPQVVNREWQETINYEFKENDLITSDTDIGKTVEILKQNDVKFKVIKLSKSLDRRDETGKVLYTLPGEFVLTIMDTQEAEKPANGEYVKQIFSLLKANEVVIRFGKMPV